MRTSTALRLGRTPVAGVHLSYDHLYTIQILGKTLESARKAPRRLWEDGQKLSRVDRWTGKACNFWVHLRLVAYANKRGQSLQSTYAKGKGLKNNHLTMARKSNAPSKAAPSKEYLVPDMASESESDNEYRYKLPHYATPTSQKSSKKGSVGTPNRPIKIPDISAGSASQPIWISDAETTDYDTETDVSNIAIRGTRTPKTRPGRSPVSVHSQPQQKKSPAKKGKSPQKKAPVVAKKAEESVEPNETTESKPKKSTQAKDSEESANEKKSKRFPRMIVKPKKPVVDMNALSEEGDDKDLEKELKEIALNGRSGMISGTPGAFDLEKGKKRTSGSSVPAGEDDADRSWHTPFSLNKPTNSRRQKLYLLVAILGLITVTSCLILVIKSGKNRSSDVFFDEPAMDARQEQMHKVVTRVTDSDILGNPTTAQFKARRWLLFRDDEISEFDEDRVIQRYSLACFFFATAGDEKWNQNNWMDGHECDNDWMGINCNEAGKVRAIVLGKFIPQVKKTW